MNKKVKTLIGILIFILFIGGASIAYRNLGRINLPENSILPTVKVTPPIGTSAEAIPKGNQEQGDGISPSGSKPDESGAGSENGEPAGTYEEEKLAAPEFTVYDADGNAFGLSDFTGKPIIINFWATWCPYCVEEMPDYEESYKKYGDEINFIMIDCVDGQRETMEKAEQFIKNNDFTFPVYYDTDQTTVATYGAYSLPTSVFIDRDGYVIAYHPGMLTGDMLQMGIDLIYDETE